MLLHIEKLTLPSANITNPLQLIFWTIITVTALMSLIDFKLQTQTHSIVVPE